MLADVTLNLQSPFLFLVAHMSMTVFSGLLIVPCLRRANDSNAYVGGAVISCVICAANLIMTFVMSWCLFEKALNASG